MTLKGVIPAFQPWRDAREQDRGLLRANNLLVQRLSDHPL